jgi:hypothetical protein
MVFPKKHLPLEKSLLCLGSQLIPLLKKPISIDILWDQYLKLPNKKFHSYNEMVLTLDFLFAINIIKLSQNGEVCLN